MRLIAIVIAALTLTATAAAAPMLTRSRARAIVRDVNLKTSDMPGYESEPTPATAEGRRADSELARCAHSMPVSRALAYGSSPAFSRGKLDDFTVVVSSVIVYRRGTQLRKDLRALRSLRWRQCLRTQIIEGGSSAGVVANVTVTSLQTNVGGAFGYRFRIDAMTSEDSQTSYADFFFMGTRSSEARVTVNSSPSPPTQAQDDDMLRIVKTRLNARANPNTVL